jgi:hypothetical protein
MVKFKSKLLSLICLVAVGCLTTAQAQQKATLWKFSNLNKIGGYTSALQGKPIVTNTDGIAAIWFNGAGDGLTIFACPIDGWNQFSIEVLFKPDGDGPKESRFVHFEDKYGNRGTLEIRLTNKKKWYLDAFLKNGKLNKGIALIDSAQLHPADKWYWAAMTYDGKKMISYVNGVKQLETPMDFPGMNGGEIAFGMRLNKVSWFKGSVAEARFSPEVLPGGSLQKVKQ